jgi:predicted HicB family RNase H-like nuclease
VNRKRVTKILTGFRLDPRLKALAVEAAAQENRSLSNYIENLIRKDVEARGLLLESSTLNK